MSKKRSILIGTLILTATGLTTRFIGFFFRIFMSHTFGEENVGLYQLIFPIYALCFSFTAAGIETAIARCVARKVSLNKTEEAKHILYVGLSFSVILSFITTCILQHYATTISIHILGDIRCQPMIIIISYILPFASIHSCICGYYLGLKQTKIPASSQLLEQLVRVASIYILCSYARAKGHNVSILFAVTGLVLGEIVSSLFCLNHFLSKNKTSRFHLPVKKLKHYSKELFTLAVPLTSNRILLNILQSVEAISIPLRLQQYGCTSAESLSIYGVLTGMALPCILFPSAITNSVSTMLLPTVAEIQATKEMDTLKSMIKKVTFSCFALGFGCCLAFLLLGSFAGNVLFHSDLAGDFIQTLAWICPFLYMNSTLISIINGLGKTTTSFFINTIGLLIRITGILVFIPKIGMNGYLWGLLLSQLMVSLICLLYLRYYIKHKKIL